MKIEKCKICGKPYFPPMKDEGMYDKEACPKCNNEASKNSVFSEELQGKHLDQAL